MKNYIPRPSFTCFLALCCLLLAACQNCYKKAIAAIDKHSEEELKLVLEKEDCTWPQKIESYEDYVLERACKYSTPHMVELILKQPAHAKITWRCVWSALERESFEIMQLLFKYNRAETIQCGNKSFRCVNSIQMADFLLKNGCKIYDPLRDEPVDFAKVYKTEMFIYYINKVGLRSLRQDHLQEMVKLIIDNDQVEKLQYLLEHGLRKDYRINGKTMLDYASEEVPFEFTVRNRAWHCLRYLEQMNSKP